MADDIFPFDGAASLRTDDTPPEDAAERAKRALRLLQRSAPQLDDALFAASRVPLSTGALRAGTRWFDRATLIVIALSLAAWHIAPLALISAPVGAVLPFLLLAMLATFSLEVSGVYQRVKTRSVLSQSMKVAVPMSATLLLGLGSLSFFAGIEMMAALALQVVLSSAIIAALHVHYKCWLLHLSRSGRLAESVVIVGATENAQKLIARNNETRELQIVGVFDDRLERAPRRMEGVPLLGRVDDLLAWDQLPRIDKIIVTVTSDARSRVRTLIDRLRWLPNKVVLLLDLDGFNPETETLAEIADRPAAYVSGAPEDARKAIIKRASDLAIATVLLLSFSPVILACAIAVKSTSPGPVFFRQRRHGFNNQLIRVWKFRTMLDNPAAEQRMRRQAVADDPRITRVGAFLRRTSLDELPQLINVLRGEMSLVGPRPHALGMTTESTEVHDIVADYAHRHRVKPGITGWAQVNGSRGPVSDKQEVLERVRFDLEYINRASFWFDLYILLKTGPVLLGDRKRTR